MQTNDENKTVAVITGLKVTDSAKLINIVTDIETRLVNIKRDYFEIGKLLSKAKEILPHGKFQQWIEIHFVRELPYSTAALFMKIYKTFENSPKTVQFLPITFLMKMTESNFPEEIMRIVIENNNSDKLDIKAITEAYELYKCKEIDLSAFESIAKKQIELAIDIEYGNTQKRFGGEFTQTTRLGFGLLFNAIKKIRMTLRRMRYFLDPSEDDEILEDVDRAISELENLKKLIKYGEGFFVNGIIDDKTGKRGLLPNEKFNKRFLTENKTSNN